MNGAPMPRTSNHRRHQQKQQAVQPIPHFGLIMVGDVWYYPKNRGMSKSAYLNVVAKIRKGKKEVEFEDGGWDRFDTLLGREPGAFLIARPYKPGLEDVIDRTIKQKETDLDKKRQTLIANLRKSLAESKKALKELTGEDDE